jgi:hypothetical protein
MQKFFFAKIEAWLVLLVILLLGIGSLTFAYIAQDRAGGSSLGGELGRMISQLAESPDFLFRAIDEFSENKGGRISHIGTDFANKLNGFQGLENVPGYLAYRTDTPTGKVYGLTHISEAQKTHEWAYPPQSIPTAISFVDKTLIVKDSGGFEDAGTFLRKIDSNGNELWTTNTPTHHIVFVDEQGLIYSPVIMPKHVNTRFTKNYRDDGYVVLSQDGSILDQRSITDILLSNDLGHLILGNGLIQNDPIHLNAVKPASTNSPYWNKDDLLMSSRHLSLVFLYRPQTNKIIWYRRGPWLNQHDPDFFGTTGISVFGNDIVISPNDRKSTDSVLLNDQNEIYVYDFASDRVVKPYSDIMKRIGLTTVTGGNHTILSDGSLFVYFSNAGIGCIHNAQRDSLHCFGTRAGVDSVSIGSAPKVHEFLGTPFAANRKDN